MALLAAGDVKLRDPLKAPLAGINERGQGGLADALGRIRGRAATSAAVSGRPQGEYAGQQLDQAGTMAGRGIEDSLYDVLGNTSYKENLADRDHMRKVALAKKIGQMNSPTTGQEILGGIGQLGPLIPAAKSLYGSFSGPSMAAPAYGSGANPYGFDMDEFGGYDDLLSNELVRR